MCRVIERSLLSPTLIRVGDFEIEVYDDPKTVDFLNGDAPNTRNGAPNPIRRFGHDRTA